MDLYKYNVKPRKSYYDKKPFYKRWWFILLVIIFFGGAGFIVFAMTRPSQNVELQGAEPQIEESPAQISAKLSFYNGAVLVKNPDSPDFIEAKEEADLLALSSIKTDKESKAIIEFSDGSIIRLDENTEIQITELAPSTITISQINGNTYSRVNKASDIIYKIITNISKITALGTAFDTKIDDKTQGISVISGDAKIELTDENQEVTGMKNVEQGKVCTIDKEKKEFEVSDIKLEDLKTDWYQWNKNEDNKKYYELGILGSISGPKLEILKPEDNTTVKEKNITIEGETDIDAVLTINEKEVTNKSGVFSYPFDLEPGKNTIEIIAENTKEEKTIKTVTITYDSGDAENGKITLETSANIKDAKLSWQSENITEIEGYKIVKSLNSNPVYPSDSYRFAESSTSTYIWTDLSEGTYHFRICAFKGDECIVYSNDSELTISKQTEEQTTGEISLSGSSDEGKVYLTWSLTDLKAEKGYKTIVSEKTNPVYPGDTGHSISDSTSRNDTWSDLTANKTYHFRVCEYTGSACKTYSNDLEIKVIGAAPQTMPTPVTLSGQDLPDGVHLTWTKNNDSDFKYYKVVRSNTNASPKYPADGYIAAQNQGELSYIDAEITPITQGTYYYSVCVVNNSDSVACSNVVTIKN